jgi:hypothetical protein
MHYSIQNLNLTGPEKIIYKYEKKFWMEYAKFSVAEAEEKAYHKIINTRKMSKMINNPKSKHYFPY